MELNNRVTERGFRLIEFQDYYGVSCSIQKSSLATEEAIWFGVDDPNPRIPVSSLVEGDQKWKPVQIPDDVYMSTRMHLNQKLVMKIRQILIRFAETGNLDGSHHPIEFRDFYDIWCSVEKSTGTTEDAIWIGVIDPNPQIMASRLIPGGRGWMPFPLQEEVVLTTRMYLTRDQVKQILPILTHFVETGELPK